MIVENTVLLVGLAVLILTILAIAIGACIWGVYIVLKRWKDIDTSFGPQGSLVAGFLTFCLGLSLALIVIGLLIEGL